MNIKKTGLNILKALGLTVLSVIIEIIVSIIVPLPTELTASPASEQSQAFMYLIIVNFIYSITLIFVVIRSQWKGLRLTAALFLTTFGLQSFMIQIETLLFGSAFKTLSTFGVLLLILSSLIKIALLSPITVWMFGGFKHNEPSDNKRSIKKLLNRDLLWKLPVLGLCYTVLYFFFGYFVAWQSPAVQEFYATTEVASQFSFTVPVQILRGMMWVGFGFPLFVMFSKRYESLLASLLMYSLFPSIQLLLPNPLMPEAVRMAHLVEMLSSMAIFGLIAAVIMTRKNISAKDSHDIQSAL